MSAAARPLFVVDDDPTGAQAQAGVPLLLSWGDELVDAVLREDPRALHMLTNSRALDEDQAYAIVRGAAEAVRSAAPEPRLVLRGDSTLRAHLLPEYAGVRDVLAPGETPPLLLVPALPAAGRVTVGGRHWLDRDGRRTPLEQTEFAADAVFAYRSGRLLDWAEERSDGYFLAADGWEVGIDAIRSDDGAGLVRDALLGAAASAAPAAVVPDAETEDDLATIAAGLRQAWERKPSIVVRCAPTFASVLSGAGATGLVAPPTVERGLLVLVGSHVPVSTAQLARLADRYPRSLVEVDAATLAGDAGGAGGAAAAIDAAVERAAALLDADRLAIVATTRAVAAAALGAEAGMRVARWMASVVERLRDRTDALLSKGGSTSAVNVRDGLGAECVEIVGPVAPGVSLWRVAGDGGEPYPVVVFPGNVGDAGTLVDLVERMLGRP
ncbi:MAG TPA: four-carbon acid sugar kinase family protein [Solirubrobacterales bacterium]|nr:four-carbon acid sugar kinase family protein [Solirubrobacterales bacterium]